MRPLLKKRIAFALAFLMLFQGIRAGDSFLFAEAAQENLPPVLEPLPDCIFSTGVPAEFEVTATDPDGDTLQYFAEGLPAGATFENGTFQWTPETVNVGDYEVTFGVTDGIHIVQQKIFFYVLPVNQEVPLSPDIIGSDGQPEFQPGVTIQGESGNPQMGGVPAGGGNSPSFYSPGVSGDGTGGSGGAGGGTGGSGGGQGVVSVGNGVVQAGYAGYGAPSGSGSSLLTSGSSSGSGSSGGSGSGDDSGTGGETTEGLAQTSFSFSDASAGSGIGSTLNAESVALGDVNNDGKMDVVVAKTMGTYTLFVNNGNGTFSEITLLNFGSNPAGGIVTLGDYNNDGFLDGFIARAGSDYLIQNNGDGTYTDVTATAGVSTSAASVGAIFADYNKDGYLDLFVVNSDAPSILYKNLGTGAFQNVTSAAGIQVNPAVENRAAVFFDAENDGDLDLYVVNYLSANALYLNQGNGTFQIAAGAGVSNSGMGKAVTAADYNNDGFTDLFVVNSVNTAALLYKNNGDGTFSNVTTSAGIPSLGTDPQGAIFADWNNDGFLDLYVVGNNQTNLFLANDGAGKFTDKSSAAKLTLPLAACQVAAGDYNQDGMVDLFVAGNPLTVYRNDSPKTNNFIQVRTVGTRSNRLGIGARLELLSDSSRFVRTVKDGASQSKESFIQNFGLGTSSAVDSFTIQWPSGTVQNVKNKAGLNGLSVIRENAAPDLAVNGSTTVNEGQKLTLNLLSQDPDNSGSVKFDTIVLSADGAPTNSTLTDSGNGTGTFEFNPDLSQSGQYLVTFRASDGEFTASKVIQITVNNVTSNGPPTAGGLQQNYAVDEGKTLQFYVTGSDPDNDSLTFTITAPSPAPNNASLALDAGDPSQALFTFAPVYDQSGVYDFVFSVSDGFSSDTVSTRITVNNVNRGPVLNQIDDKTVKEGAQLTFTVNGSDPDGDALSYTASDLPTNATFDTATRTFTFNPDFGQAGDFFVKFQVSDGNLGVEKTVKITVESAGPKAPNVPNLIDPGIASFSGKFRLQWSDEASSGAVIYEVQESATSDFSNVTRSFWPRGTFEPITVSTSGTYYYRVCAYSELPENGGVASQFSNVGNILVDLERGLDILNYFPNQGVIDGDPFKSQSLRTIVTEPEGLGTLGSGNALRFDYDLKNQSMTGLFFENLGQSIDIAKYKTINLRVRGDETAGYPHKLVIEMRRGGEFSSFVIFFKPTTQYQDFSFPFYQRTSEIDTITLLVEDDVQGDGMGTVVIDEFFLSERPYVANPKPSVTPNSGPAISDEGLLDLSEAQAAMFFYDHVVGPGYVKDAQYKDFASIASTGFGLTALTILAKRYDAGSSNWNQVTPAQAQARAKAIMEDILRVQGLQASAPTQYGNQGFLFHFINADGSRFSYSEVSVVDHALLVAGVLTAGEYFGGDCKTLAEQIYTNTNWKFFLNTANHLFYRAWAPGGGLQGAYDSYTDEILLISLLAIGTAPTDEDLLKTFYSFPRTKRSYTSPGGETFTLVNSFFGSAFTYLYAHGWFDFEKLGNDKPELVPGMGSVESVNWWTNSVQGIRSNRQFCIDRSAYFPFSFHSQSWGLSAVERPDFLYEGRYGAPPFNLGAHDGTVAVYVPLSSMPLLRTMAEESVSDNQGFQVLKFYYSNYYQNLFGDYGAADSLDNEGSFSSTFLGIDKGLEAIMIENYRTRFIWDTLKKNARIKTATEKIFGAAPSDEDSFSAVLKNVSDDQLAEKLSFGQSIMGAGYVSSGQYIEIQYNLTSPTVGVHVFTNNIDYEGDAEGAGFIGQTDKKESVSMFWTAFDGIQAGGYPFSGNDDHEAVIQDRRRSDFLNPDTVKGRLIVDGNNTLMPSKSGKGQGGTPVYVYLGTNFQNASAQLYKAAVVVEICHFS